MAKYCVFITLSMPKLKKNTTRESFLTRPSLGASIGVVAELMVALGAGKLSNISLWLWDKLASRLLSSAIAVADDVDQQVKSPFHSFFQTPGTSVRRQ